jgi:hypothetical protein
MSDGNGEFSNLFKAAVEEARSKESASGVSVSSIVVQVEGETFTVVPAREIPEDERAFKIVEPVEMVKEYILTDTACQDFMKLVLPEIVIRAKSQAVLDIVDTLSRVLQNRTQVHQYLCQFNKVPRKFAEVVDRMDLKKDVTSWKHSKLMSMRRTLKENFIGLQEVISSLSSDIGAIQRDHQAETEEEVRKHKKNMADIEKKKEDALTPFTRVREWLKLNDAYEKQSLEVKMGFENYFLTEKAKDSRLTFEAFLPAVWASYSANLMLAHLTDIIGEVPVIRTFLGPHKLPRQV